MTVEWIFEYVRQYGGYVDDPPAVKPGSPLNLAAATPCQWELGLQPSPLARQSRLHEGWYLRRSFLPALPTTFSRQLQPRSLWLPHVDGLPVSPPTDTFHYATTRDPIDSSLEPIRTTLHPLPIPSISTTASLSPRPIREQPHRDRRGRPCASSDKALIEPLMQSPALLVHSAASRPL